MRITSESFHDGEPLPPHVSADAQGTPPLIDISEVPARTVSLALTVHDPDVPKDRRPSGNFDHWVLWNLPSHTGRIASADDHRGVVGSNTAGTNEWYPAAPPPGDKAHRYYFTVYALDTMLELPESAGRSDLEAAINGHVIESAQLMGTFRRG